MRKRRDRNHVPCDETRTVTALLDLGLRFVFSFYRELLPGTALSTPKYLLSPCICSLTPETTPWAPFWTTLIALRGDSACTQPGNSMN